MRDTYAGHLRLLGVFSVPKADQRPKEPKFYLAMRYPLGIEFCWASKYGFADDVMPRDITSLNEMLEHSRLKPKLYIGFVQYYETE